MGGVWELRNYVRERIGAALRRKDKPRVCARFTIPSVAFPSWEVFVHKGWGALVRHHESGARAQEYVATAELALVDEKELVDFLCLETSKVAGGGRGGVGRAVKQVCGLNVCTRVSIKFFKSGRDLNSLTTRCRVEYDFAIITRRGVVRLDTAMIERYSVWEKYRGSGEEGAGCDVIRERITSNLSRLFASLVPAPPALPLPTPPAAPC